MRILTWNVARRVSALVEQATAIAERDPDVLALQEVTARTLPLWRAACATLGLAHVRASLDHADPARQPASRRSTGVLIATREPLADAVAALPVPWAEAALSAELTDSRLELFCVHVPNAANGWVKVETLRAIRAGLASAAPRARVLCGDLNTPRRESPDGEVLSFASDSRGRLRPERGSDWEEAELCVVPGLRDLGYRDVFRTLHGYKSPEPSWTWERIAGHSGGWRLDHVFASPQLRPLACTYHHEWRERGLSDHSALEADLEATG